MEDLYISVGNYVQNSQGQIIQFLYGNDAMDGSKLEKQGITLGSCTNDEFQRDYVLTKDEIAKHVIKRCVPLEDTFQERELNILTALREDIRGTYYFVPFNVDRIIASVMASHKKIQKTQMGCNWICDSIEEFLDSLKINKILTPLRDNLLTYTRYVIWSKLSTKRVMQLGLSKKNFKDVLGAIREKFAQSMVQAGEMVGPIAAQSIGEKLTQCVLDSFHSSGIASKTQMSGGVQRFQEIIHVSKKPSNPALMIQVKPEYQEHQQLKIMQEQLKYTNLQFFTQSVSIYYDADMNQTGDNELITQHRRWFPEEFGESPWVVVIELNDRALYQKKIEMVTMGRLLLDFAETNNLHLMISDHNSSNLKVHLRLKVHGLEDYESLRKLQASLLDLTICGIPGIIETEICDKSIGALSQGSQLRDILLMDFVDTFNTTSTNVHEILEIFGIEAARQSIIEEVYKFLNQNGVYVNERHIEILADFITNQGILIALDRHGIAKSHHSVLTAASFETVVPFLSKAGIHSDRDALNGVSPNIMMGQIGQFGTGLSSVLVE